MEQAEDPLRVGLKSRMRDLELRALELKRAANALERKRGEPVTYQDDALAMAEPGGSLVIKKDQYYGQKIHSAMRQYLAQRKAANMGPATLAEIYKALCDGGMKFETENEDNRKANMRFLLRKNSSIFHRLPDKVNFALVEWYPGIKEEQPDGPDKRPRSRGKRKSKSSKTKAAKRISKPSERPAEKASANPTNGDAKVTQEQAVRAAINAVAGEFKKQDVVDWIEKKYPGVNATQKRESIFAMLGKLKDEIEVARPGKGAEPSTYRRVTKAK